MADNDTGKVKKHKSVYDPSSEDEDEEGIEDTNKILIQTNTKSSLAEKNQRDNFHKDKPALVVFLRKFLSIYSSQMFFVGILLIMVLFQPVEKWLLANKWFCCVGIFVLIVTIIPVALGVVNFTWGKVLVMSLTVASSFMIFSVACVVLGNPFGFVTYFGMCSGLLTLIVYTCIITEEYNLFIAWAVSMIPPSVLIITCATVFKVYAVACVSSVLAIAIYMYIIAFVCYMHIDKSAWLTTFKYEEDNYIVPAIRLHYDFLFLFLNMIRICRGIKKDD